MTASDWMRAADRDREEAADVLREAYAEGRLDHAELDERTDAAFRARTWGELRRLTADLPRPAPREVEPCRPPRARPARARVVSLSVLVFAAVLACMAIGAATRSIAVIALSVLVGSAVTLRRG